MPLKKQFEPFNLLSNCLKPGQKLHSLSSKDFKNTDLYQESSVHVHLCNIFYNKHSLTQLKTTASTILFHIVMQILDEASSAAE